jgi:threonine dehydrogenase-like Zn-dependent dehydrogenase
MTDPMTTSKLKDHWESVYRTKQAGEVSWFAPHLRTSIELLQAAGLNAGTRVIDIGAGASTLIDDVLDLGIRRVIAVDLSEAALRIARDRLGRRGEIVRWVVEDVTRLTLPANSIDIWHDRAALHFLVDEAAVRRYVSLATEAIAPGGHAVIGGFAADGPEKCSGLPVVRREPEDVEALFRRSFELVQARHEIHQTPWGSPQRFSFALLRKVMD